ncbi:MAG TPA: MFS transporter [Acidimicrobiales bacterium]
MTQPTIDTTPGPDPRRWITLGVLIVSVVIVVLDTSVLNVAIPTMLRELDTTVPSLEWVVSGYALTLASLLIIGGRLGDIYGHRRLFIIGLTLFGTGSAIAAVAPNVGVLILGEAVIEGTGAALMVPSTLALLSGSFHGRERAGAFAAWGAAMGGAAAFGPVIGGFLTTNYSWRWAFGINVIISPIAIVLALLFIKRGKVTGNHTAIDFPGALLVACGTFLVVFGLSQGPTYGWLEPKEAFHIAGLEVWPTSLPISVVSGAFLLGAGLLAVFVRVELVKERNGRHPLFEFSQMRRPSFRYGTVVVMIAALGQLGMLFCLPLFLQTSSDLTAQQTGLWLLPLGTGIIIGAQLGGRLARHVGVTNVIRAGFVAEVVGVVALIPGLQPGASFWRILPCLMLYGAGSGVANSQLTNVVLWGIPAERAGAAGGANSTARQLGAALGAATLGTLLTVHTIRTAVSSVQAAGLPTSVTDSAVSGIEAMGPNWQAPADLTPDQANTLNHLFDSAVATGARWALGFTALMFLAGGLLSLLIPQIGLDEVVSEEAPLADVGTLALEPH